MAQALAPHFGERDFHAALVADDSAVLHALVLAAQALPVSHRAEDAGAEQPVALRLEGAVVDGLGLGDLAVRPAADLFRRSQADANGVEIGDSISQIKGARAVQGFLHCSDSRALPQRLLVPGLHRNPRASLRSNFGSLRISRNEKPATRNANRRRRWPLVS